MGKKAVVNQVWNILQDYAIGRGKYSIVLLQYLDPTEENGSFRVLVGAPWLTDKDHTELIRLIYNGLAERDLRFIGSVGIANLESTIIKELLEEYPHVEGPPLDLRNVVVDDQFFPKLTIVYADPAAVEAVAV